LLTATTPYGPLGRSTRRIEKGRLCLKQQRSSILAMTNDRLQISSIAEWMISCMLGSVILSDDLIECHRIEISRSVWNSNNVLIEDDSVLVRDYIGVDALIYDLMNSKSRIGRQSVRAALVMATILPNSLRQSSIESRIIV